VHTTRLELAAYFQKVVNSPDFYALLKQDSFESFFYGLQELKAGLAIYPHFEGFLGHD